MNVGFLIPHYPNEKRVVLFPEQAKQLKENVYVEQGFGLTLDIPDQQYLDAGCLVVSKEEVYKNSDTLFALKGIAKEDWKLVRENQIVIGFIQPASHGKEFYENIAKTLDLKVVDLDNINPAMYFQEQGKALEWIPSNFVYKNSILAGYSAMMHATTSFGMICNQNTKIAVLGSGNVSQGALKACNLFHSDVRMFYRKTMNEFYDSLLAYDIVINGIDLRDSTTPILSISQQKQLKKGCLIVDVAAVTNDAIEAIKQTSIDIPIYKENDIYYYCVNNTPSLYYKEASKILSEPFFEHVYSKLSLIGDYSRSFK